MELKDRVDILVKRAELIYKKMLIFLAISSGSWIYGLKDAEEIILRIIVLFVFFLSSV